MLPRKFFLALCTLIATHGTIIDALPARAQYRRIHGRSLSKDLEISSNFLSLGDNESPSDSYPRIAKRMTNAEQIVNFLAAGVAFGTAGVAIGATNTVSEAVKNLINKFMGNPWDKKLRKAYESGGNYHALAVEVFKDRNNKRLPGPLASDVTQLAGITDEIRTLAEARYGPHPMPAGPVARPGGVGGTANLSPGVGGPNNNAQGVQNVPPGAGTTQNTPTHAVAPAGPAQPQNLPAQLQPPVVGAARNPNAHAAANAGSAHAPADAQTAPPSRPPPPAPPSQPPPPVPPSRPPPSAPLSRPPPVAPAGPAPPQNRPAPVQPPVPGAAQNPNAHAVAPAGPAPPQNRPAPVQPPVPGAAQNPSAHAVAPADPAHPEQPAAHVQPPAAPHNPPARARPLPNAYSDIQANPFTSDSDAHSISSSDRPSDGTSEYSQTPGGTRRPSADADGNAAANLGGAHAPAAAPPSRPPSPPPGNH